MLEYAIGILMAYMPDLVSQQILSELIGSYIRLRDLSR